MSNPTPPTPSNDAPQAAARPDAFADKLFDSFYDPKDGVKFNDVAARLKQSIARDAEDASKKALVPAAPKDYQAVLPSEFKLPDGVEYKFDDTDPVTGPALQAARDFAHAKGYSQAEFSQLLQMHAQAKLAEDTAFKAGFEQEKAKLGANGTARIDALSTWMKAQIGSDLADELMGGSLVTAKQVEAFEKLMQSHSSQGGAGYSNSHRAAPATAISEEQYAKMTPSERLEYARNASQKSKAA